MRVNDMDKHQLTEVIKRVKEKLKDPELDLFDVPFDVYEEINNPATDKDGFVHKYYLSEGAKGIIEVFIKE